MSGTRVPFDLALPFAVATTDLPCGARRFKRGDAFPWRDLGLSEIDLLQLWIANQVDAIVPVAVATPPRVEPVVQRDTKPAKQQRARS